MLRCRGISLISYKHFVFFHNPTPQNKLFSTIPKMSDPNFPNDCRGPTPSETEATQTITGWKERLDISSAKSRKIRGGNYVQIATVDQETKLPHNRTVVFRGFVEMQSSSSSPKVAMKMITDARSEKVSQIKQSPACEMVWWFPKSSEQYRLSGNLSLVSEDEPDGWLLSARKQQWSTLSDMAREQFFWLPPGEYSALELVPKEGREEKLLDPPSSFLLMLLVPTKVKYLRLTDNFALLDEFHFDECKWETKRMNP